MVEPETRENDERRDDVLEREFMGERDRDRQEYDLRRRVAERSYAQESELFNLRQVARDAQAAVTSREDQSYSGLAFRDAALHSTAVGAEELMASTASDAITGTTASVTGKEQEEVPDEGEPDAAPSRRRR